MGLFDLFKGIDMNAELQETREVKGAALKKAGYTNVKSIGGINRYKGKIEKGRK